ncbi:MAG: hypothetical protein LBH93_01940 [Chitinispirillales bacterium]|jgi:hypothetical protein|nr:hypothetical protein [Chitinispirillales bacterium]
MPQANVKTASSTEHDAWIQSLPVVHYPPEVVERWDKEFEIAEAQIATGELKPQAAAELFAEIEAEIERDRGKI